jgi:hypothetical protein
MGFDMFIIDNMSTDGTRRYLKEQKIPHCIIDTDGCFDLRPLLAEMNNQLHRIKPDWFIYHGMDVFPVFNTTLQQCIMDCECSNHNQIALNQYSIHAFDEEYFKGENPFNVYFQYRLRFPQIPLISKYHNSVEITPDCVNIYNSKIRIMDGAFFELHVFNTPKKRADVVARREKAWENGMPANWGTHYREEKNAGFKPPICKDIRDNIELFELYSKLGVL